MFDINVLIAKYSMDEPPMDPELNTTVQTTLAAEKLEGRAFPRGTEYNQWLFDGSSQLRV